MRVFFLALHPHPMGAAGKLLMLAVSRHRKVAVRGKKLVVNLIVNCLTHGSG